MKPNPWYRGLPGLVWWLPLLPIAFASFVLTALLIGVMVGAMAAWDFYRWTVRPMGGDAS